MADGAWPEMLVALGRAVAARARHANERDVTVVRIGIMAGGEQRRDVPPIRASHRADGSVVAHLRSLGRAHPRARRVVEGASRELGRGEPAPRLRRPLRNIIVATLARVIRRLHDRIELRVIVALWRKGDVASGDGLAQPDAQPGRRGASFPDLFGDG